MSAATNSALRMDPTRRCLSLSYPTRARMTPHFVRVRSGVCGGTPNLRSLVRPGEQIPIGKHVNLPLDSAGRKSFFLEVDTQVRVGLYAQHTADEFDLQLTNANGAVPVEVERTWVAQHEPRRRSGFESQSRRRATSIPAGSTRGWASCSVNAAWTSSE